MSNSLDIRYKGIDGTEIVGELCGTPIVRCTDIAYKKLLELGDRCVLPIRIRP